MRAIVSWLKELTQKATRKAVKVVKLTVSLACVVVQKINDKRTIDTRTSQHHFA